MKIININKIISLSEGRGYVKSVVERKETVAAIRFIVNTSFKPLHFIRLVKDDILYMSLQKSGYFYEFRWPGNGTAFLLTHAEVINFLEPYEE